MRSLVASTVHNDSDGDEATERYDDEKTETDSTVSVSASSSGSFDESAKTVMMSEDDHVETGETVMALMFEMNRESGTTLVLVTHDRAIAARCDRQLVIEAGRLKPEVVA